jgi:hypothetical protein
MFELGLDGYILNLVSLVVRALWETMSPRACLHRRIMCVLILAAFSTAEPQRKRVIVTYGPGGRAAVESALVAAQLGVAIVHQSVADRFIVLEGGSAASLAAAALQLPGVVQVEQDRIVKKHMVAPSCPSTASQFRASARSSPPARQLPGALLLPAGLRQRLRVQRHPVEARAARRRRDRAIRSSDGAGKHHAGRAQVHVGQRRGRVRG